MDKQNTVAVTRDAVEPEDEQTRVQRFVMRLAERVTTADIANGDWVCGRYPTTASDGVNALPRDAAVDDSVIEFVQLLIDRIEGQQNAIDWLLQFIESHDGRAHWCCPECDEEICEDSDHVEGCLFLFLSNHRDDLRLDA